MIQTSLCSSAAPSPGRAGFQAAGNRALADLCLTASFLLCFVQLLVQYVVIIWGWLSSLLLLSAPVCRPDCQPRAGDAPPSDVGRLDLRRGPGRGFALCPPSTLHTGGDGDRCAAAASGARCDVS
jgi:hypothetical protein